MPFPRSATQFLKLTVVGGLIFLVPLVLILVVLGHAMRLALKIAQPLAEFLPMADVAGVAVVTLLSALALLVIAFLAGIAARTASGRRISQWFEDSLLGGIPQYQLMKSMAEGLVQLENSTRVKPVLVSREGGWQIGYLLETSERDWVTVFLPMAPTPMAGNVMFLPAARVRALDIPMGEAMSIVKRMGAGSADALRGADLSVPAGA
jgi:uncharacterized membrane protein